MSRVVVSTLTAAGWLDAQELWSRRLTLFGGLRSIRLGDTAPGLKQAECFPGNEGAHEAPSFLQLVGPRSSPVRDLALLGSDAVASNRDCRFYFAYSWSKTLAGGRSPLVPARYQPERNRGKLRAAYAP